MGMKEPIFIVILCSLGILAMAATAGRSEPKPAPEASCTCPTLDQLLAQKAAKEKQERQERAEQRRQKIKDRLSELVGD